MLPHDFSVTLENVGHIVHFMSVWPMFSLPWRLKQCFQSYSFKSSVHRRDLGSISFQMIRTNLQLKVREVLARSASKRNWYTLMVIEKKNTMSNSQIKWLDSNAMPH